MHNCHSHLNTIEIFIQWSILSNIHIYAVLSNIDKYRCDFFTGWNSGFHDAWNKVHYHSQIQGINSECSNLAKILISDNGQFEGKVFTEPQIWCSVKSMADHSRAFHRLSSLADCRGIPGILRVATRRALWFSLQAVVPHGLGSHEVHHHSHDHPANHHHHEISRITSSIALSRARKPVLQTLIISAVALRSPQQRQEPPHGHLMVEDALTGIPSVCHLAVMSSAFSLLKACLLCIGITTPTFSGKKVRRCWFQLCPTWDCVYWSGSSSSWQETV